MTLSPELANQTALQKLVARSRGRRKLVASKPPEPPDLLALQWGVKFQRVVQKHLAALVRELMASPHWDSKEERRDEVSSAIRTLLGRLLVRFTDLVSEDLVALMGGLVDQTSLFNLEQTGEVWRSLVGVPYKDTPAMEAVIKGYQALNSGLIKSLVPTLVKRVEKVVSSNLGETSKTIAKRLQEETGVSASKAKLFARDQVLKLNGQLTEDRHREAGITQYEWVTSGDERVRPMHRNLNGKRFSWERPPVVSSDGRREHPGGDYQCRCVANPVIDL